MSTFRTEIKLEESKVKIEYDTPVLFLGSCFSTNIGNQFEQARLNVLVNPYGVIYNPCSVASTLRFILQEKIFKDEDIHFDGEKWHSFYHHSTFSHQDKETCLNRMNEMNAKAVEHLKEARFLFITFGTAWTYRSKEFDYVVSNCHKYPASHFNRSRLSVEDIVNEYRNLLNELQVFNPDLQVVFTVSPVRHWKDGAHGNQLSKATLLLAIDCLVEDYVNCDYFPAYELVMDDLRDYRFYTDDMLHPNKMAIEYIWEKFKFYFFSKKSLQFINELFNFNKAIQHNPFDLSSESYQKFIYKLIDKISILKNKFPNLDLGDDMRLLESRKRK